MYYTKVQKDIIEMLFPNADEYNLILESIGNFAEIEMLAKACANTALQVSIQGMICEGIRLFGDDRQKNEFLKEKGLVEGRSLASFALTEPCCGSDAKSIQTKAELSNKF